MKSNPDFNNGESGYDGAAIADLERAMDDLVTKGYFTKDPATGHYKLTPKGEAETKLQAEYQSRLILDLCVERLTMCCVQNVGQFHRWRVQVRLPGNPDWTKASITYFNLN